MSPLRHGNLPQPSQLFPDFLTGARPRHKTYLLMLARHSSGGLARHFYGGPARRLSGGPDPIQLSSGFKKQDLTPCSLYLTATLHKGQHQGEVHQQYNARKTTEVKTDFSR